ncbi:hypothetical protein NEUTE1DRAFT_41140 [Neurospora tetrasperma FGSC 2508]|uniref:Uncharacterized protein n=1 Tax=Neurospora tetrasperma (strain FGSC 2508 / ATCC MYA-4615 / P0657) TaxID=510951 RepID=F8MN06_NEUT8|nr:uncharacterized protein NEUTE1DRAFT_41140 [Neurospora tetrasperma FGSC 2508]EGO58030.1 hypothetical protein NEUTE1DRAFT_41140 [Neurospora tetrasperma FGSC 2508]EGZ71664.1 hypothetical protein NEUTE2DRAFT_66402 [Neurospora tetrasperma FGSC 2509]
MEGRRGSTRERGQCGCEGGNDGESSSPSKAKLRAVVQGIPSRWLTLRPKSGPFLADHEGFISSALEWESISTLGSSIDCNLQRAVRK